MTDFEKSIKRGMTREKFVEIRDHKYGDGGNFFNYTYGDVSSFLTWNRDENDKDKIKTLPKDNETNKARNLNDGSIHDWDQEKLSKRITTDIVFLGENLSGNGKPIWKFPFQNARRHKWIVKTFFNTEAEGAYFTDIIKPDKRLLDKVGNPANGGEVRRKFIKDQDIQKDHFLLFKEELKFIGAVKPLLIVFGKDAEAILKLGLDKKFLKISDFYDDDFVEIDHYFSYPKGGEEGYSSIVRGQLAKYITIP
jgi:hypothetical protein